MYAAIWNVKVFDELFELPQLLSETSSTRPGVASRNELVVDVDFEKLKKGKISKNIVNRATLKGSFISTGIPEIVQFGKEKTLYLDGNSYLVLDKKAPASLDWNDAFTFSAWVKNPEIGHEECMMVWNTRENMLQSSYAAAMYGTGNFGVVAHGDGAVDIPFREVPSANEWHQIVVTLDGMQEYVYVDGKLNTQMPISLFVKGDRILVGASGEPSENFSGYFGRVQLYDKYHSMKEVESIYANTKPSFLK